MRFGAAIAVAAALLAPRPLAAHELRPGLLEVRVDPSGALTLRLRLPPTPPGAGAPALTPILDGCAIEPVVDPNEDPEIQRWRGRCDDPRGPTAIALEGLAAAGHDVVVDLHRGDGPLESGLLRPAAPTLELGRDPNATGLSAFVRLGVDHILGGLDHLLFVVGLVALVALGGPASAGPWSPAIRAAAALTGFTVAHSLTLAAATLGWLVVAPAPVEACIALSLLLLARALALAAPPRSIWAFAGACGLLHGLGFAGALAAIGLPEGALVPALVAFNLGVELGQIAVAALLLALFAALARAAPRRSSRIAPALALAIGAIAAAMLVDRVLRFADP